MVKVCRGGEGVEVSGFGMRGFFGLRGKGKSGGVEGRGRPGLSF